MFRIAYVGNDLTHWSSVTEAKRVETAEISTNVIMDEYFNVRIENNALLIVACCDNQYIDNNDYAF